MQTVNTASFFFLPLPIKGEEVFEHHRDCLTYPFAVHQEKSPDLGNAVAVIGGDNAAICSIGVNGMIPEKGENA